MKTSFEDAIPVDGVRATNHTEGFQTVVGKKKNYTSFVDGSNWLKGNHAKEKCAPPISLNTPEVVLKACSANFSSAMTHGEESMVFTSPTFFYQMEVLL